MLHTQKLLEHHMSNGSSASPIQFPMATDKNTDPIAERLLGFLGKYLHICLIESCDVGS